MTRGEAVPLLTAGLPESLLDLLLLPGVAVLLPGLLVGLLLAGVVGLLLWAGVEGADDLAGVLLLALTGSELLDLAIDGAFVGVLGSESLAAALCMLPTDLACNKEMACSGGQLQLIQAVYETD